MGMAHWEREYQNYDPDRIRAMGVSPTRADLATVAAAEPGEEFYVMAGDFTDEEANTPDTDHRLMFGRYVAMTVHNFDNTDFREIERLRALGFEKDYR